MGNTRGCTQGLWRADTNSATELYPQSQMFTMIVPDLLFMTIIFISPLCLRQFHYLFQVGSDLKMPMPPPTPHFLDYRHVLPYLPHLAIIIKKHSLIHVSNSAFISKMDLAFGPLHAQLLHGPPSSLSLELLLNSQVYLIQQTDPKHLKSHFFRPAVNKQVGIRWQDGSLY